MGTGNITLYWYALCCFFSVFVLLVASGLVGYGRFRRWRADKLKNGRNDSGKSLTDDAP